MTKASVFGSVTCPYTVMSMDGVHVMLLLNRSQGYNLVLSASRRDLSFFQPVKILTRTSQCFMVTLCTFQLLGHPNSYNDILCIFLKNTFFLRRYLPCFYGFYRCWSHHGRNLNKGQGAYLGLSGRS